MSQQGMRMAAKIFHDMQVTRLELLRLAEQNGQVTATAHQDFMLAQLLERGKDSMKDDFAHYTLIDIPPEQARGAVDGGP